MALLGRSLIRDRSSLWPPVAAVVAFATVFTTRAATRIDDGWAFSLFDDAMISMTYARNLAEGHGLVWNAGGTAVEGYTNLGWTLWMAVLHLTGLPDRLVAVLVSATSALLLVVTIVAAHALARRLLPDLPQAPAVAAWLVAGYYPLAFWSLRGMEVGLVAALVSVGVLLAVRLRERFAAVDLAGLAVICAVGVLVRTDVAAPLLLVAAYAVAVARPRRRAVTAAALVTALAGTLGAHTLFRLAYYGDALPNTYYLKVTGVDLGERLARGLGGLGYVGLVHLWAGVLLALVLFVLRRRRIRLEWLLLAGIAGGQLAYSVYVGGDAWEQLGYANRYVATAAPALMVLAAGGVSALAAAEPETRRRVAWPLAALAAAVAVLAASGAFVPTDLLQLGAHRPAGLAVAAPLLAVAVLAGLALARRLPAGATAVALTAVVLMASSGEALRGWAGEGAAYVADDTRMLHYGVALAEATPADTEIAVVWAGAIPYFARRPAVDLLGKNDPAVARQEPVRARFHPGHDKWDYAYSVGQLRPDVVAQLFSPSEADLARMPEWGYTHVADRAFVHDDAAGVDLARLRAYHRTAGRDHDGSFAEARDGR